MLSTRQTSTTKTCDFRGGRDISMVHTLPRPRRLSFKLEIPRFCFRASYVLLLISSKQLHIRIILIDSHLARNIALRAEEDIGKRPPDKTCPSGNLLHVNGIFSYRTINQSTLSCFGPALVFVFSIMQEPANQRAQVAEQVYYISKPGRLYLT